MTLRVKSKADPILGAGTVNADVEVERGPKVGDSGSEGVSVREPAGEEELGIVEGNGSANEFSLTGKSMEGP